MKKYIYIEDYLYKFQGGSAENQKLKKSVYHLKRKNSELTRSLDDFKKKFESLANELDISVSIREGLNRCASKVPAKLFEMTSKRARGAREYQYDPSIKKFSLTLQQAVMFRLVICCF